MQHFAERKLNVSLFNGIHAERFGLYTHHTYEVDNPGSNYHIRVESIGNILSHYMLWSALAMLWDDFFLVLEDDAKLEERWHIRLNDAISNTPHDFDMLYLGSCCCNGKPRTLVGGDVYEVRYPMCTHAYIVARKALHFLLSSQRKVYAPIDISLIFHSLPHLKVYTVLPRIADQFDVTIEP